jgi:hypothetical protein
MIDPPDGGIPALLLALAYNLTWRASKRDRSGRAVGILHDDEDGSFRLAAVSGPMPGTIEWRLVHAGAPDGVAAYLLPEDTAAVLRRGELAADGAIEHEGARYRVRAVWIAPDHVAELVPA